MVEWNGGMEWNRNGGEWWNEIMEWQKSMVALSIYMHKFSHCILHYSVLHKG